MYDSIIHQWFDNHNRYLFDSRALQSVSIIFHTSQAPFIYYINKQSNPFIILYAHMCDMRNIKNGGISTNLTGNTKVGIVWYG